MTPHPGSVGEVFGPIPSDIGQGKWVARAECRLTELSGGVSGRHRNANHTLFSFKGLIPETDPFTRSFHLSIFRLDILLPSQEKEVKL